MQNITINGVKVFSQSSYFNYLERSVIEGVISRKDADTEAILYLCKVKDRTSITPMSAIGKRWLTLTIDDLISDRVNELEQLRQEKTTVPDSAQESIRQRKTKLNIEIRLLKSQAIAHWF